MASVEELDHQVDSGMGSSDARSPEVKSLLPDDEDDDEEVRAREPSIRRERKMIARKIVPRAPGVARDVCKMQGVLRDL